MASYGFVQNKYNNTTTTTTTTTNNNNNLTIQVQ